MADDWMDLRSSSASYCPSDSEPPPPKYLQHRLNIRHCQIGCVIIERQERPLLNNQLLKPKKRQRTGSPRPADIPDDKPDDKPDDEPDDKTDDKPDDGPLEKRTRFTSGSLPSGGN